MKTLTDYILALLLLGVVACGPESTADGSQSGQTEDTSTTAGLTDEAVLADSNLATRSLDMAARAVDIDFEQQFPLLSSLLQDQPDDLAIVKSYAEELFSRKNLRTESDILALMEKRKEIIIPIIQPYIEQMDEEKWYEQAEALEKELNQLGMTQLRAEGMFVALGQAEMLSDVLRTQGSSALRLYADFSNAEALSRAGEYPYANMEPYFEMLLKGEALMKDPAARMYYEKIDEDFRRALRTITDIHLVQSGEQTMPIVGGINTDPYPFMAELETHQKFLQEHPESRYHPVVKKILDNTSTITAKPINIYLIVTEWAPTLNEAEDQVFELLNQQKDVPHYLEVRRGNGTDQYAITYRFFEDENKANATLEQCRADGIEADLLFVSVKGNKLYQIGI
ncbi:MAG: hypothetical protein D6730_18495 [Bacteroidetes bacterium]|nr:MAG: hypothetical protein D6730_18495 [Bacteroidota bacterium]